MARATARWTLRRLTPRAHDLSYGDSGEVLIDPDVGFGVTGAGVCAATLDAGRVVPLADALRPDRNRAVIRLRNAGTFLDGFETGDTSVWSSMVP
jgi:hypothetical protein